MSNLPSKEKKSEQKVVQFYDNYFNKTLELPASDYDALTGFFRKKGFEKTAALSTAQTLISQAKIEKIPVFTLIESFNKLDYANLTKVITKILNSKRDKTSKLGYKIKTPDTYENRNITDNLYVNRFEQLDQAIAEVTTDYIQDGYVEVGYVA